VVLTSDYSGSGQAERVLKSIMEFFGAEKLSIDRVCDNAVWPQACRNICIDISHVIGSTFFTICILASCDCGCLLVLESWRRTPAVVARLALSLAAYAECGKSLHKWFLFVGWPLANSAFESNVQANSNILLFVHGLLLFMTGRFEVPHFTCDLPLR
jgi:hypothetical protein